MTADTSVESLSERIARVSNEIYERTKKGPNWVMHTHGPNDDADTCFICQEFGLTKADWDDALSEE